MLAKTARCNGVHKNRKPERLTYDGLAIKAELLPTFLVTLRIHVCSPPLHPCGSTAAAIGQRNDRRWELARPVAKVQAAGVVNHAFNLKAFVFVLAHKIRDRVA